MPDGGEIIFIWDLDQKQQFMDLTNTATEMILLQLTKIVGVLKDQVLPRFPI